jgi:hypothetical protein
MKGKPSYLGAAFNARPFGMPVPPNWFGIGAFGILGALVNPGLWLIGLGLEGLYLWSLSRNARFRAVVDAKAGVSDSASRYESLYAQLERNAQAQQQDLELEATEIISLLQRSEAHASQIGDVRQMAWLHLKLLAARAAFAQVVAAAEREPLTLAEQERSCRARLEASTDEELRRSLEQQLAVIQSRRAAHADAKRRQEIVEAELGRLRQQVSLVREQALLATDENNIAHSLDALSASLNEANRWLKDQSELFAGLDQFTDEPPPAELLASRRTTKQAKKKVSQ